MRADGAVGGGSGKRSEYVLEFWARGVVECGETFVVGDVGGGDVEGRDGLGILSNLSLLTESCRPCAARFIHLYSRHIVAIDYREQVL